MTAIRPRKERRRSKSGQTPRQTRKLSRGLPHFLLRALLFASLAALPALVGLRVVAQTPSPVQVSIAPAPDAQALEIDRGAAGLWQLLLKLHTRASLIHIVAHPDTKNFVPGTDVSSDYSKVVEQVLTLPRELRTTATIRFAQKEKNHQVEMIGTYSTTPVRGQMGRKGE